MARMIDADRLLRELTALSHGQVWPGWTYDGIRLLIERQPTLTQPNKLLTLEELREMDEPTPVWWKRAGCWCLCERGFIIAPNGNIYEFEETDRTFYRRPPEGKTDA